MIVDPKKFGLHPATKIEQTRKSKFALVIRRKSRIIMKDGENILKKAERIKSHVPQARVLLKTTAPVCSKTRAFLSEHHIGIEALCPEE